MSTNSHAADEMLSLVANMSQACIDSVWVKSGRVVGWVAYYRIAQPSERFRMIGVQEGEEYRLGRWNSCGEPRSKDTWCRLIAPYIDKVSFEAKNILAMLSLGWEVRYWAKRTKTFAHFAGAAKITDRDGRILYESLQPHQGYQLVSATKGASGLQWQGCEGLSCYADPS